MLDAFAEQFKVPVVLRKSVKFEFADDPVVEWLDFHASLPHIYRKSLPPEAKHTRKIAPMGVGMRP